jgi:hypothetical protein
MPSISTQGATALDAFTASKVADGTVPLLFTGLASKEGIFYSGRAGPRVAGQPEPVQDDTSE